MEPSKAAPSSDTLYWLHDTHVPQSTPADEPEQPPADSSFFDDTKAAAIIAIISAVATAIFRYPSLFTFTACAGFHLLTKVAKKLLEDYSITGDIEHLGLVLVQELPYLHLIAALVAIVFSGRAPYFSITVAAAIGILSAINIDVVSLEANYQKLQSII